MDVVELRRFAEIACFRDVLLYAQTSNVAGVNLSRLLAVRRSDRRCPAMLCSKMITYFVLQTTSTK